MPQPIIDLFKIGIYIDVVEYLCVMLSAIGIVRKIKGQEIMESYAKIAFTSYFAFKLKKLKRQLIKQALNIESSSEDDITIGAANVYNKVANVVLYIMEFLFLLDPMEIDINKVLKSLFAFSRIGTLVLTYASKDLVTQAVMGFKMSISDKFFEGEYVKLGDGTMVRIVKLGWMETVIMGTDNVSTRIPNSQL